MKVVPKTGKPEESRPESPESLSCLSRRSLCSGPAAPWPARAFGMGIGLDGDLGMGMGSQFADLAVNGTILG